MITFARFVFYLFIGKAVVKFHFSIFFIRISIFIGKSIGYFT